MKNAINFIKKHDNIFVIIIIGLIMLSRVYYLSLLNTDESFNFANAYKMANGLTIYKDNNVIITPLFFYISSIFLKIFGENIFVFRTLNLIIATMTFFLCYVIFKQLKVNKRLSLLYTLIVIAVISQVIEAGANYNVLAYMFYLLGLYLLLRMKNGTAKNIVQGFMLFLVFLSYQKLGAGYFVALIVYEILNKDIKSLFKELLTALMLLIAFLLYLYTQNNLYNFINYAVLGIGEFGSTNWIAEWDIIKILLMLLLPMVTLMVTIVIINTIKTHLKLENEKEIINQMLSMYTFSICACIIAIPILNVYHLYLANILMLVDLLYLISFLVMPILEEKSIKNIINTIIICMIIFLLIRSGISIWNYAKSINEIPKDSPFYGGIMEDDVRQTVEEVGDYIIGNEKNTIVLSTYAPLISVYTNDLNNGVYDLVLRGNLGIEGEEGLIEKIKGLNNTQVLLLHETDEEKEIYQFASNAANYIKENFTYVGQINRFDIYETK